MNKQQTIELLQKQIPSFYSLEQVIKIISDIEEEKAYVKVGISDELIDSISEYVADEGLALIEEYDLEMSYKEVELSSVEIDISVIKRAVRSAINNQ